MYNVWTRCTDKIYMKQCFGQKIQLSRGVGCPQGAVLVQHHIPGSGFKLVKVVNANVSGAYTGKGFGLTLVINLL